MPVALCHYYGFPAFIPVLLLLLSTVDAFPFSCEVVGVLGGSTIEVGRHGKTERIHLHGIDCPERGQPYGDDAKQAISALVFAMEVTVETHGKDKSGRILADVLLADGTNVNQKLVKEGWCWWYRKSAPDNTELERLELEAREAKKGLWADSAPIPPWEFRKARRGR